MTTTSSELIRDYFAQNIAVQTLEIKQYDLLLRLFNAFSFVVNSDKVNELIQYSSETINGRMTFNTEIPKVSKKALFIMITRNRK